MTTFKTSSPIVQKLFKTETPPSEELLNQLFELPKQELIKDLENLLNKKIEHPYQDEDGPTLIAMHSLFLLTELKSEESLSILLNLCKQHDDFLFHYFDEHTTETMWQDVLVMGKNNLSALFEFLKNCDLTSTSACVITDGLTQIALHFPDMRIKIIDALNDLYKHLYQHRTDYKIEHDDWLIWLVKDIKAVELLDILKTFHDHDRMNYYSKWNDFEKELKGQMDEAFSLLTIQERYDSDATPDIEFQREYSEFMMMHPETEDELEEMSKKADSLRARLDIPETLKPIISKSIGRNAPCPCGSGKKYKHCCIEKTDLLN